MPETKRARPFVFALAVGLTALYLAASWPLSARWSGALPDFRGPRGSVESGIPEGDRAVFLWNLWWTPHAIYDRGASPFFTPLQNAPAGLELVYAPICPLYGLLGGPFRRWATPAAQLNFWMIVSAVLASLGAALLVLELGGGRAGATLAAFILFFDDFHRNHAPEHLNIFSTGWPVLTLWLCVRLRRRREWGAAIGAAICAAATIHTSHHHAIFLAIVLALYYGAEIVLLSHPAMGPRPRWPAWAWTAAIGVWILGIQYRPHTAAILMAAAVAILLIGRLYFRADAGRLRAHIARLALVAALALALSAPMWAALARAERPAIWAETATIYSAIFYSNTPLTIFLTPPAADWLNARLGIEDAFYRFRADGEFASWPGAATWLAVAAILILLRGRARWKRWLFIGGALYVLSWGVCLQFPGAVRVDWLPSGIVFLPGYLLKLAGPLQDFRVFSRASFYTSVALAVFAGVNLAPALEAHPWGRRRRAPAIAAGALALGLIAERFRPPVAILELERPPEAAVIAAAPEDTVFWFVPPGANSQALYWQTLHGRPIANYHTYRIFDSLRVATLDSPAWRFFAQTDDDQPVPPESPDGYSRIRQDLQTRGVDAVALLTRYMSPEAILSLDGALRDGLGMTRIHAGEDLFLYALDPSLLKGLAPGGTVP